MSARDGRRGGDRAVPGVERRRSASGPWHARPATVGHPPVGSEPATGPASRTPAGSEPATGPASRTPADHRPGGRADLVRALRDRIARDAYGPPADLVAQRLLSWWDPPRPTVA